MIIRAMDDNRLADIILQALYHVPDYLSIQDNILVPLKVEETDKKIMLIRRRLFMQGMIEEQDSADIYSLVKITPKGYQAIDLYGTYDAYCKEQKKMKLSQREILYLKERNIRLKNLNIIIGIISFIGGILLSSPIKNILKLWLEAD